MGELFQLCSKIGAYILELRFWVCSVNPGEGRGGEGRGGERWGGEGRAKLVE